MCKFSAFPVRIGSIDVPILYNTLCYYLKENSCLCNHSTPISNWLIQFDGIKKNELHLYWSDFDPNVYKVL